MCIKIYSLELTKILPLGESEYIKISPLYHPINREVKLDIKSFLPILKSELKNEKEFKFTFEITPEIMVDLFENNLKGTTTNELIIVFLK